MIEKTERRCSGDGAMTPNMLCKQLDSHLQSPRNSEEDELNLYEHPVKLALFEKCTHIKYSTNSGRFVLISNNLISNKKDFSQPFQISQI